MESLTLEGRHVRLEPLDARHTPALAEVGLDPAIWEFSRTLLQTIADVETYVARALETRTAGTAIPFVTIDRGSGLIVGSTRFENIELSERRVEIGWSWLTPRAWRTPLNNEAKYLMLRHAFEVWKCVRVEFKVLETNERSLRSITAIGARREGVLRKRLPFRDGSFRDVVYLSILDEEWPAVKQRFERRR
jgi:RimJ/RimL family protein N-acetyltransferase